MGSLIRRQSITHFNKRCQLTQDKQGIMHSLVFEEFERCVANNARRYVVHHIVYCNKDILPMIMDHLICTSEFL